MARTITDAESIELNRYFRLANYLSACQLYLLDNPLLKRPLERKDLKKKIVGHWGTVPGQNFIYTHLNRIIKKNNLNMIYISGPGHGGNFLVANTYIEGTYSEVYPNITQDEEGLKKLFKQFSFPGGISSHAAPEDPGSIHEGGELGYSLAHAFGAVFDNPKLIAACVIGDGEAETGPLATSWNSVKFLNPKKDGIVLPILNLNGYKISNPTVLSRFTDKELGSYFYALGYKPYLVKGKDPLYMHKLMAKTMDLVVEDIERIKKGEDIRYPMIIFKTPKGWTGPKEVDGKQIEGTFRAHQVPVDTSLNDENIKILEKWLRSYHPEELFDSKGHILKDIKDTCPKGNKRMGSNPNANGGLLLKDLILPDLKNYAFPNQGRGIVKTSDMRNLGSYVRDVFKNNPNNFRAFSPDEAYSNRLYNMFEATKRDWQEKILSTDENLSKDGHIMDSYLSEHMCEGWLEGYLLTGRHGFFNSYEAFIRVVDSMVSQHAKWLKICNQIPWRRDIASLNLVLTSNVWQQDHNGFTHQDPGFLNHIADKKADVVRIYLPFDTNSLLTVFDHSVKSRNYINVIVASKQPSFQWLSMDEAIEHCKKGVGIWDWASNDEKNDPDIVMCCGGDTPTLETLAAINILHDNLPDLKIRCINVVDLMKLTDNHPHGLSQLEFDSLFTIDKPVIFNFHGYPSLIHSLTYNRHNRNISVHGYMEEGSITTPFDMRVQNKIDRYDLVIDVINHLKYRGSKEIYLMEKMKHMLIKHKSYIDEFGEDLPEVRNFKFKEI